MYFFLLTEKVCKKDSLIKTAIETLYQDYIILYCTAIQNIENRIQLKMICNNNTTLQPVEIIPISESYW